VSVGKVPLQAYTFAKVLERWKVEEEITTLAFKSENQSQFDVS